LAAVMPAEPAVTAPNSSSIAAKRPAVSIKD
jgi:hypothetical protein